MRLFETRWGRIVTRRWTDDESVGLTLAVTFPLAALRYRIERRAYTLMRRHPKVVANELELTAQGNRVELLKRELREVEAENIIAFEDAHAIHAHAGEIVQIIRMYQGSLRTLCAPDPHEARVKVVVENFFKQFEDRYE